MIISFCGTIKKGEDISETLLSIKNQSVKVDEIIITNKGNIAIGRNDYLNKAKGDIIFTFDSGCIYEKDYVRKMLKAFKKDTEVVMGIVLPMKPKNLIQEFCVTRMPKYYLFSEEDWNKFLPSNRQVALRIQAIKKLGLLPEELSRADDTYWFNLARIKKMKFAHCDAIVYWETKSSLKDYLKTVYYDNKVNKKFKIKSFQAPCKTNPLVFPYGTIVSFLAMIIKLWSKI